MACGINVRNRYATLSDNDLNTMVSSCTEQNRMIGCNSILAQLQASGDWMQLYIGVTTGIRCVGYNAIEQLE